MLQLLHTISGGSWVEKSQLKDSCTSAFTCYCLFSKEKTQQACFIGFLLPLLCAQPDPTEPSRAGWQPFLLRSGGQMDFSPSLFLLLGLDGYLVF